MDMKKTLSLLLFVFAATLSYAQSDTIITYHLFGGKETAPANAFYYSYITQQKDGLWVRVDFYVHNDSVQMKGRFTDRELKNKTGPFSYYHYNGQLSSAGAYENNKKQGLWLSWAEEGHLTDSFIYKNDVVVYGRNFSKEGTASGFWDPSTGDTVLRKHLAPNGRLSSEGQTYANKREGRWKYYDTSGKLMSEAIYQKDSVIASTCYDQGGNIQKGDCIIEREPQVKGGNAAWRRYLERAFAKELPRIGSLADLPGVVMVRFLIDKEGRITDVHVKASTEPRLNEVAIRIVSNGPLWEPGIQHNRKVRSYHTQPVVFMGNY
jgi:antitoxin component YwqK of YwqJK toxin-antitoxin module